MKKSFVTFKNESVVDSSYPKKTWMILEHAIWDILINHNFGSLNFEHIYRYAPLCFFIYNFTVLDYYAINY